MKSRPEKPRQETNPAVEAILERIRDTRNFDFRNYKRATLTRRIERRMSDRNCSTAANYAKLLDDDPAELDRLISSMLIKVTAFFRDAEMWEELSARAIPQMLSEKPPGEDVRVWSAGCATGEEAFSLAILLAEAMGPSFHNQEVKVFGTDLDQKAIATARRGMFSPEQVQSVPPNLLKQYFYEEGGSWCVRKEIRRNVVFGINNLVSDAPISRIDLLACRNVFIYLDAQLQKRVLARFYYSLRRRGLIVLGKSELIPFASKVFEPIDLQRRIYRKDGRRDPALSQGRLISLLEQESLSRGTHESREEPHVLDAFHRDVLQAMRLPMIVTARDGTVLLWNNAAAALWGRPEAEIRGKKLPGLALSGLAGEVLIEKTAAVREGRSEREEGSGVFVKQGETRQVQLSVEIAPVRDKALEVTGIIYVIHDVSELREMQGELRTAHEERKSASDELQTVNEELQSANEELETTNEELQSANEELQTTNEELQSTNEELETTNEELQSTNAELDATNRELAHRTEEMNALAYVYRTVIRSLPSAVVVLDQEGRVRMWNLGAERLLGMVEAEAVGQLLWNLHVPALGRSAMQRIRKSIAQNSTLRIERFEYELATGQPGKASVAAVPILDGGAPLGSVIIFDDTTRLANVMAELEKLRAGDGKRRARK